MAGVGHKRWFAWRSLCRTRYMAGRGVVVEVWMGWLAAARELW